MIKVSIYEKLKYINDKDIYPFCMPGHKRNKDFFLKDIYKFDYTEIDGTDVLRNAEGIIKEAQEAIAFSAGADNAFICVNGSTGALQGAIFSCIKPNEKIIVATNCHKSVLNAIILSGAIPVFISPKITEYGFFSSMDLKNIKEALEKYSDIKACVITSPTYEGIVSDIKRISEMLHKKGIKLIIDEAHGAYFNYFNFLPKSAIKEGADIVVQSWHKTLPAPNQCAVVLSKNTVDKEKINLCLSLTETTSPSYIFMMMIDRIREMFEKNVDFSEKYGKALKELRNALSKNIIIKLLEKEEEFYDYDIGKLVFIINSDISGKDFCDILRDKYKIQSESYGASHIILMTSPADCKNDFECFEKLKNAINELENELVYKSNKKISFPNKNISIPDVCPRDVFYAEKEEIIFEKSENRISGDTIFAYPPGIPIIYTGDIITKEKIDYILTLKNENMNIIGFNGEKINVLK